MSKNLIRSFLGNENGATAIEYALIASIVSISIVVGLSQITTSLQGSFASVASYLVPSE